MRKVFIFPITILVIAGVILGYFLFIYNQPVSFLNTNKAKRVEIKEYYSNPVWSPDGTSIIYTVFERMKGTEISHYRLYVMHNHWWSKIFQRRKLVVKSGWSPDWSSDSKHISHIGEKVFVLRI